ncbi:hypothetical protein OEZ85_014141 [Tetradesmus obliquus]|uniref:Uncharacterized protein n=1 Tax=Tetradesmus obliquus TaxID=3088 RepID=A0ABY8U837_TETOB|nr:hypothetical protein OEZ85_014141 [Tetradesmus obliquus]
MQLLAQKQPCRLASAHRRAAAPAVRRAPAAAAGSSSSSSSSTRCRHVVRAAAEAEAEAASPAQLQMQLQQKEAQLAAMFNSGQPMPKAGDVARLRAEITALADRLAGRPVRQLPIGGHDAPMGAVAVKSAHVRARSKTEDLAFRAYEMVEEQMRGNQGMGNSDDVEMARLEAENIQLRAQAFELLKRQQQLETMLAEVQGSKPPELLLETTEELLARMKAKLVKS